MSNSLASTKLYLMKRLHELNIYEVSDIMPYMETFIQIIGDLKSVESLTFEKVDDAMTLLCSLPPLLTALMCIKETTNLEKVTASLQTYSISNNSISRKSFANEDDNGQPWLELISWEPRAFLYHNFLTNEECEHLISLAKPKMARSRVAGNVESSSRTSSGTFLTRGHDKIIKDIENRISEFTFIPVENGEGLQVIRYEVGQKFEPHFDGYQRIATVLMYLSDVEEGGETVFTNAKGYTEKGGLFVSPKKGDALLFWNLRPDGSQDNYSKHAGYPVIKGNKWASTKWFRHNKFP